MNAVASVQLEEIMAPRLGSIDPAKHPDEEFDLYSIPACDNGEPDVTRGRAIGSSKHAVEPGDVLLSRIVPHIRRAWVVGDRRGRRLIASGEWIVFRSNRFDSRYLRHVLLGNPFHAELMRTVSGVGGSLLRARPVYVAKIRVPLPPLAEQRRVAEILDKADALRLKRRAALAQLDTLTKSIFIDMFGDPATNPKGWKLNRLGEICEVGSSKRVFVEELVGAGVPFYRGTEIGRLGEGLVVEPSLFITREHFEKLKAQAGTPSIGDLLLPSICPDGRIYMVRDDKPFYFKDARVLWIKVDASRIDGVFLKHYLSHLLVARYSKIASGTTFAELKIVVLKSLGVQAAPLDLQQRFAAIVESIECQKARYRTQQAELDTLSASLQNRAFRCDLHSAGQGLRHDREGLHGKEAQAP